MQREEESLAFPTLNIYSSPRVVNQRVNNSKIPLMKYREAVTANKRSKNYEADIVDKALLRRLEFKDGLIFSLKGMKKPVEDEMKREVNYFEKHEGNFGGDFKPKMEKLEQSMRRKPDSDQLKSVFHELGNVKILVCVCMYNQSKNAINLTLNGIYKNLPHLREEGITDGDIAVVLIQDGILKLVEDRKMRKLAKGKNSMVKFYEAMDRAEGKERCELQQRINTILDEYDHYERMEMLGNVQRNKDIPPSIEKNIALLYQNLWRPTKTYFPDSGNERPVDGKQQLKIFSCFKHTNGTKLSSHLWFFEGFCQYLKPEYCVLLDVGTVPDEKGIATLIKGLSQSPDYGGATGFMSVDSQFPSEEGGDGEAPAEDGCLQKFFCSIQRAQEYEYIISHFLDKNCESALGFLHVLPGAWSAYRYEALIKSDKFELNLLERSYFKMILNPELEEKDFREANMYLAEDRILSLGIYAQLNSHYILKYVPKAIAYTDPMKDHENLMNQRRRWINSSLFAFMYVFKNYYFNVVESKHNFYRKFISVNISMLLALLSMFNSYIAPAIYFFVLYSTIYQLGFSGCRKVAAAVALIYTLIFLAGVAGALTGRQWSKRAGALSVVLSFFTFLMFLLVIYNLIFVYLQLDNNPLADSLNTTNTKYDANNLTGRQILILAMAGINIGTFVLLMAAHLLTHPMFVIKLMCNTFSYMSYIGAYSQTMVIHGFCNVDDVSWGTKGSAGQGGKKYEVDKVYFVSSWLFINALLAFIFIYVDIISLENGNNKTGGIVLIIIAVYGTVVISVKTILALIYHFLEMFRSCCYKPIASQLRVHAMDEYWNKTLSKWKQQHSRPHLQEQSMFFGKK